MSFTPNEPQLVQSGISGQFPAHWFGTNAVDGDARPFINAGKGSTYTRVDLTNDIRLGTWTKEKNDGRDDDWCEGMGVITETVSFADFTDGGAAVGTYTLKRGIPQGAQVWRTLIINVTGFTGNTSAVLTIGDGTDVDRYNTGTEDVFTTVTMIDSGAVSGSSFHTAAANVVLTLTSASDFTAVTAGQLTIRIYYYN